jgi:hypothetical protein
MLENRKKNHHYGLLKTKCIIVPQLSFLYDIIGIRYINSLIGEVGEEIHVYPI